MKKKLLKVQNAIITLKYFQGKILGSFINEVLQRGCRPQGRGVDRGDLRKWPNSRDDINEWPGEGY